MPSETSVDRSLFRTTDDVYRVVRAEVGAMSPQAVYDALAALTDTGVLRRNWGRCPDCVAASSDSPRIRQGEHPRV